MATTLALRHFLRVRLHTRSTYYVELYKRIMMDYDTTMDYDGLR